MSVAACPCPAKINFGLVVRYRRPDGYHEIESIFLPVDFADSLNIQKLSVQDAATHGQLHPGSGPFPIQNSTLSTENLIEVATARDFESVSERGNAANNLLLRVLDCVNHKISPAIHLHLHLKKRIPSGAGLGGGSSDAGTLLRWLRESGHIDAALAHECARKNGADIPFFLNPVPSIVTGIGDAIDPIRDESVLAGLRGLKGILALSSFIIPTKNAYTELKRHLQSASDAKSGSGSEKALRALLDADEAALAGVRNDFEEFAFRLHPELERVKKTLQKRGALYASMTGSGSAIYGLFRSDSEDGILPLLEAEMPGFRFVPFRFQF